MRLSETMNAGIIMLMQNKLVSIVFVTYFNGMTTNDNILF